MSEEISIATHESPLFSIVSHQTTGSVGVTVSITASVLGPPGGDRVTVQVLGCALANNGVASTITSRTPNTSAPILYGFTIPSPSDQRSLREL